MSADLATAHRTPMPPRVKASYDELAGSLIDLTRSIAKEPKDTRALRLTLAVIELTPECSPSFTTSALRTYAKNGPEAERIAAEELRVAIHRTVNNARLIRFRAMVESAIAVLDERRSLRPRDFTDSALNHHLPREQLRTLRVAEQSECKQIGDMIGMLEIGGGQ